MTPTPEQQNKAERIQSAAPKMYELLQQIRLHSDKLPEHLIVEIAAVLFNIDKTI
jgi:hypothetical protein